MSKWSIYTPDGVGDILFEECRYKRYYENIIMDVFDSAGYFEVETPTYEYYDVFDGLDGINQEDCFKFFDREGRILTLRPDLTTPIARVCATKLNHFPHPIKLSYLGNAYRYEDVQKGGRQREFTQAGIEFIGENSTEADAEVIVMTIKALLETGLKDFKIDIGQIMFFKGLIKEGNIDSKTENMIQEYINMKDTYMLNETCNNLNIPVEVKELLLKIPEMFGEISIVEQLLTTSINHISKDALINLKEVYEIIKDYGYEEYVSIDLGLLQSIKYYTGIIFKGFTYGIGFPICGGGRYDNLIEKFGKKISATGSAISVSRLVSILVHEANELEKVVLDATVFFDEGSRKNAILIADMLREDGMSAELKKMSESEICYKYLEDKDIFNGIFVSDKKVTIINRKENTTVNTTVDELVGEK